MLVGALGGIATQGGTALLASYTGFGYILLREMPHFPAWIVALAALSFFVAAGVGALVGLILTRHFRRRAARKQD